MKHYKFTFIALLAFVVLGTPWLISNYPKSADFVDNIFSYVGNNYTAVFFQEVVTISGLRKKYDDISNSRIVSKPKIRIMIVPGHEPDFGGTEYRDLKERDMAVDLANDLAFFLRNNTHYEVVVARDKNKWNPDLEKYFNDHWSEIKDFVEKSKVDMMQQVNSGSVKRKSDGIIHNKAPKDVALRLFGINKWNNENKIDITIHIHFNDYPRANTNNPGKYSGFSIYVPEKQYSNSTTTIAIANNLFKRLAKYNAVSDLPKEEDGVIEEQELIAIGSNNTLDAPSMLIEYGYIYEPQFSDPIVRETTIRDLAFQTYLGIQDFFGSGNDVTLAYDTLMLPFSWKKDLDKNSDSKKDILALQTALLLEGVYPPVDRTKNDCPRSGRLGPCTLNSLNKFQIKYGIKNEVDRVGDKTKEVLNQLYSVKVGL
jgi:N-acetylmuramoyl-L-alanine amidase